MGTEPDNDQERSGKEYPLAQLLDLEDIRKRLCKFAHSSLFR